METINSSFNNLSLLVDYNHNILSDVISNKVKLKTHHSEKWHDKRKGRISIQDKVEMVRCNGSCGKYNRS